MSASSVPAGVVSAGQGGEPGRRRWFVLGVVGLAQLMIVLDITPPSRRPGRRSSCPGTGPPGARTWTYPAW